jgi:hypothetical protein
MIKRPCYMRLLCSLYPRHFRVTCECHKRSFKDNNKQKRLILVRQMDRCKRDKSPSISAMSLEIQTALKKPFQDQQAQQLYLFITSHIAFAAFFLQSTRPAFSRTWEWSRVPKRSGNGRGSHIHPGPATTRTVTRPAQKKAECGLPDSKPRSRTIYILQQRPEKRLR